MLDTATKKRIDDCRDILVGKLPDPKAQIEQITIALIYKFMDDMDKEAIELGGKAKFFTDYKIPNPEFPNDRKKDIIVPFAQYSWDNLRSAKITAVEKLRLYSEAIQGIDKNPNIPQLFRDIFKNAFLPYRDPETLNLFLKTISEFEYTHSEKLGDAFEYLLSVMGSQGDAGQFRTPRHIIDFLVAIVDPQKNETILDPACGTAGFLISAFKHIKEKNKKGLTPDERKKMIRNFVGYDISPDMVRLSLVNLYLHGFSDPHIWEYDTLSSEERWDETFDVVLANPPFMSPKGGIRPHKKFSISSNRSEVLFVDYIAEHLNPKGRAGIIVPEGVIFQSGTAYKDLRKMLVENYLYAVVSLPAGVFNPYSGVKTSILFMDKQLAKQKDEILFVKIENDGYNLGAQRNEVKGSQLGEAVELIQQFRNNELSENKIAHAVAKKEIAKNGDYNLSGERYKAFSIINSEFEVVQLSNVCEFTQGVQIPQEEQIRDFKNGYKRYLYISDFLHNNKLIYVKDQYLHKEVTADDLVMVNTGNTSGKIFFGKPGILSNNLFKITFNKDSFDSKFLYYIISSVEFYNELSKYFKQGAQPHLGHKIIGEQKIPFPPLLVQQEVVAEIEGYQKIIDGAKAVVESYKPSIDIDSEWEMVELESICDSISDGDHMPPPKSETGVPFITISNVSVDNGIDFSDTYYVPYKYYDEIKPQRKPRHGDILYTVTGSFGIPIFIDFKKEFCFQRHIGLIRPNSKVLNRYLYFYLLSPDAFSQATASATGVAQKTVSLKSLRSFIIPLPSIETQQQIVSKIEQEQALVNANKQLITLFEQKIKDRIAKVWGAGKEPVFYKENEEMTMAAEQ